MNAFEELIDRLISFTPEQMERFMSDEITLSILRPGEASESYLPGVPSNSQ